MNTYQCSGKFLVVFSVILVGSVSLSQVANAATFEWNTDSSGLYQTETNWTPNGVPGVDDIVELWRPTNVAVTVTLNATASNKTIWAQDGATIDKPSNFTLDFNGYSMNSTGTGIGGAEANKGLMMWAQTTGGNTSLTLKNTASGNSTWTMPILTIGQNGGGSYEGVSSSFHVTGSSGPVVLETLGIAGQQPYENNSIVGRNGEGQMYVQGGAVWNSQTSIIIGDGGATTHNNLLQVTGAGSAINSATGISGLSLGRTLFYVGVSGNGTLQVLDQAAVTTDDLSIARAVGSIGKIEVEDAGSSLTAKRLFVGGGVNTGAGSAVAGGTGSLTVSDGGSVNVSQEMIVFGGGTVNFTNGTLSTTGSTLLSIQGGSVTGNGTIGGSGGVALEYTSGGSLNAGSGALSITNDLRVGESNSAVINGIITGAVDVVGTTWVRSASTLTVNGTLGGAGGVTLDGSISGTGTINKAILSQGNTISSTGTLTLGSSYTVDSGFASTISAGTIAVNGTATVVSGRVLTNNGTLAGSGNLVVDGTINGTGTINKTGGTINGGGTVGGSVTTTLANGAITGGTFNNGVTVTGTTISGGAYNSTLDFASGAGSTISAGTIVVAGGTTVASGGAVAVNSTLSGAGALTVHGTLSGTGTINKAVTVASGGTLSPGNSPGNPTYSSLDLSPGGNYNWQVVNATGAAGTAFDTITVTGGLDLTTLSTVTKFNINLWSLSSIGPDVNGNAANFDNSIGQSWTLVSAASVDTTGLSSPLSDYFTVNVGAANGTAGFSNSLGGGSFSVSATGTTLRLDYTAIPEPSTWIMVALGIGFTLARRRRGSGFDRN